MATYQDVLDFVEQVAHRNSNDTSHTTMSKRALGRGIDRLSGYADWWFQEVELKLALVAGKRLYDLPTEDQAGNTVDLKSVNQKSFRTKALYQIDWWAYQDIEQYDPNWTDQENTNDPSAVETASPYAITRIGDQLAFYPTPGAAFIADNPFLYFRGYKNLPKPSDSGSPSYSSTIQDVPNQYHHVLDELTLAWVYRQARSDRWREAWKVSEGLMAEMLLKSNLTAGLSTNQSPVAPQWRRGRGGLRGFGRNDYGARG